MSRRRHERRDHRRIDVSCPLVVLNPDGRVLFKIRTVNVSDSGLYFETPASNLPDSGVPDRLALRLSIPRSSVDSFELEEFQTEAELIRAEPLANDNGAAMAVRFDQPIALNVGG